MQTWAGWAVALALGALTAGQSAQAAVFKCADDSGKTVYQGTPCDGRALEQTDDPATRDDGPRWRELNRGILVDSTTQMRWTRSDNGADIDWDGADSYCRTLTLSGGGWSLPTTKEIRDVLDCQQRRCRLPDLFQLSLAGPMLWSRTKVGSNRAEFADLGVAALGHAAMHAAQSKRALCVRMP